MFDLAGNEAAPDLYLETQEEAGERLSGHSNTEAEANGALGFSRDGVELVKGAMEIGERLGARALQTRCSTALAWPLHNSSHPVSSQGVCGSHRVLDHIYRSNSETEKAIRHFEITLRVAWRACFSMRAGSMTHILTRSPAYSPSKLWVTGNHARRRHIFWSFSATETGCLAERGRSLGRYESRGPRGTWGQSIGKEVERMDTEHKICRDEGVQAGKIGWCDVLYASVEPHSAPSD